VAHVDEIHSRVYVAEHLASKIVDHDFPGRRRLYVHIAHRSARIDDDNRQPAACPLANLFFSLKLASLVIPDHIVDRDGRGLVGGTSLWVQTETSDGACINNAADSFIERSSHHVCASAHVCRVHLDWILAPKPVVGGAVIYRLASFHRGP